MDNRVKVYEKSIEPMIKKIRTICNENKIPYFVTFAVNETEDGKYQFASDCMTPETLHLEMSDRTFSNLVNVLNGFKTVPNSIKTDSEMDDEEFSEIMNLD